MRIKALLLALSLSFLFADTKGALSQKIESFIGGESFEINKNFINRIFRKSKNFISDGKIDDMKILKTLKNNGLLNLRFSAPKEINVIFKSQGRPVFLMLSLKSALQSIGYSYFQVKQINYIEGASSITIELFSEYMIDPIVLIYEMSKRGYAINNVERMAPWIWEYSVNLVSPKIQSARPIKLGQKLKLRDINGEYWLELKNETGQISIQANSKYWQPKITLMDKNLNILNVIQENKAMKNISFEVVESVYFVLISDAKNSSEIKSGIQVQLEEF